MGWLTPDRSLRPHPLWTRASVFGISLVLGGMAAAQPAGDVSLNHLVLGWMQGNYATPLVCKIDGASRRGLRRILIAPPDDKKKTPESVVRFNDLEAETATRCFTEIGGDTPNITGELVVRHPVTKLRETAPRDFKLELRRKRGFDLDIVRGELVMQTVGLDAAPTEPVDFRGGKLGIHILRSGADGLRLLQDLPSPRKVRLEFVTRGGDTYSFAAALSKPIASGRNREGSAGRPQSYR